MSGRGTGIPACDSRGDSRPDHSLKGCATRVGVVIPARNEQETAFLIVRRCLESLVPRHEVRVCLVDNGSSDATASVAREAGAEVVTVSPAGYGRACQRGSQHLGEWPDVLLFVDADGSSRPEESERLLEPIAADRADLVIGVRLPGAPMTPPQRWGTRLAATLIRLRWGQPVADIGPFRALRRTCYEQLEMQDLTWGWTVEMQIQAVRRGLRIAEVPVSWEHRLAGKSKISGTVAGVLRAGARIVWTIGKFAVRPSRSQS